MSLKSKIFDISVSLKWKQPSAKNILCDLWRLSSAESLKDKVQTNPQHRPHS